MNNEIWKDIIGYEGLYQVSNYGRIKSLSKFINNNPKSEKIGYFTEEKVLKPFKNPKGYQLVRLYKEKQKSVKKVHRIVAEMFIPNLKKLPQVNHIDGNKKNNRVDNLEWCTAKDNSKHAWENNLIKKRIGKDNKLSRIVIQYDLDGNFIKQWNSITEAQNVLKIRNISEVCRKNRNKAGGYIWRYKND